MDRNLGALDDKYHPAAEIKAKYYQFGRKDPFNCNIYCWTYDSETFAPIKSATADGMATLKSRIAIDDSDGEYKTEGHNVPFSAIHPTFFIMENFAWSSETDLFGGLKLEDDKTIKYWNDPRPFIKLENEEKSAQNENKSFFDPCPQGWRIPVNGWVSGFRGDANGSATGDFTMNFQWDVDSGFQNRGRGRTYVPLGYLSQKGQQGAQTAFFPACGYKNYLAPGLVSSTDIYGLYWTSTPSGTTSGFRLDYYGSDGCVPCGGGTRAYGLPIRCLRE